MTAPTSASPPGIASRPTPPASLAKAGANYMNSQLIRMEADINGYAEGIALDVHGYLSEGSGENLFIVRNGVIYTHPACQLRARRHYARLGTDAGPPPLGLTVVEQSLPRELLYIADEVFFTGTAAEVTPIRSVDRIPVADGNPRPHHQATRRRVLRNRQRPENPTRFGWLTPVNVNVEQTVSV